MHDMMVDGIAASMTDSHGGAGGTGRATVELLERAECSVARCEVDCFDVRDRQFRKSQEA
jgi:hypothetical protein